MDLVEASSKFDVIIVGGGVSGCSAAYELTQEQKIPRENILLLEGRTRLGGRTHTVDVGLENNLTLDG